MFEIAGGIILAVLFFLLLPQIIVVGLLGIVFFVAIAVTIVIAIAFFHAPEYSLILAFVLLVPYIAISQSLRNEAFAARSIPGLLRRLFELTPDLNASLRMKPDRAIKIDLGSFQLRLRYSMKLTDETLAADTSGCLVSIEVIDNWDNKVACTYLPRAGIDNPLGTLTPKAVPDDWRLELLKLDLEKYISNLEERK